jgi:hypothetical protein
MAVLKLIGWLSGITFPCQSMYSSMLNVVTLRQSMRSALTIFANSGYCPVGPTGRMKLVGLPASLLARTVSAMCRARCL